MVAIAPTTSAHPGAIRPVHHGRQRLAIGLYGRAPRWPKDPLPDGVAQQEVSLCSFPNHQQFIDVIFFLAQPT